MRRGKKQKRPLKDPKEKAKSETRDCLNNVSLFLFPLGVGAIRAILSLKTSLTTSSAQLAAQQQSQSTMLGMPPLSGVNHKQFSSQQQNPLMQQILPASFDTTDLEHDVGCSEDEIVVIDAMIAELLKMMTLLFCR